MKFKVIGWTSLADARFPKKHVGTLPAAAVAVEREIKERGYLYPGKLHETAPSGAPVLNDGTKVWYDPLSWDLMMAEVHGLRGDMRITDAEYLTSVGSRVLAAGKPVLPPAGVDESLILPRASLAETFVLSVSRLGLNSLKKGATTLQIVECGHGFERAAEGDFLLCTSNEESLLAEIVRVEVISLAAFLEEGANFLGGREFVEEKKREFSALAAKAVYEGETADEMKERVKARFPDADTSNPDALALTVRVNGAGNEI